MTWELIKQLNEGADLYCPNCGENLGKETENYKEAYCGQCGTGGIKNPRGYSEDELEDEL